MKTGVPTSRRRCATWDVRQTENEGCLLLENHDDVAAKGYGAESFFKRSEGSVE